MSNGFEHTEFRARMGLFPLMATHDTARKCKRFLARYGYPLA